MILFIKPPSVALSCIFLCESQPKQQTFHNGLSNVCPKMLTAFRNKVVIIKILLPPHIHMHASFVHDYLT